MDYKTGHLIRQIPNEETLQFTSVERGLIALSTSIYTLTEYIISGHLLWPFPLAPIKVTYRVIIDEYCM